jgi:hypothetical protein
MVIAILLLELFTQIQPMHAQSSMQEKIIQGLQGTDAPLAAIVADRMTDLEEIAAGVFQHHQIVQAKQFLSHGPQLYFFAVGPHDRVSHLTRNKSALLSVAQADGLQIKDAQQAMAYLRLANEILKSRTYLSYIVESLPDFRFRPGLQGKELKRQHALEQRYAGASLAMSAHSTAAGYEITYLQITDRNLERVLVQLRKTGEFTQELEVMEEDMPTVWGL